MADIADKAAEAVEVFQRIAKTRREPEGPEANGYCYNCGDPTQDGYRWCDDHCRHDWQRRAQRRAG